MIAHADAVGTNIEDAFDFVEWHLLDLLVTGKQKIVDPFIAIVDIADVPSVVVEVLSSSGLYRFVHCFGAVDTVASVPGAQNIDSGKSVQIDGH